MSLGYSLSLAKANLAVLAEMGVPENNIAVSNDCTCCNPIFGSFRRQNPVEGTFTVQAAWVSW
jgi:copper oxidase (laccase) domain-containing protein